MPFQSRKQRSYLRREKPKIYKKWKKKYGTKIKKTKTKRIKYKVRGSKKRRGTIRRRL